MLKTLLYSLLIILLIACSPFNKVVKSDDYQRKFELADELFNKKEYIRSITLYEQVYQKFPKTGEGELSYYRIGKGYYFEKDFDMAGYYLGAFSQRFPFSPKVEETMFLAAMCNVQNSPSYELDQTETEIAINSLQQFINKYPNSVLLDSCNNVIDRLRYKLELKDYESVRLYAKTENYRAAVTTAETFLQTYSMSKYKEEVHYLLVENSYHLTKNSIEEKKKERIEETIKRYRNFVNEFPNTKYLKRITQIYEETEQMKEFYKN